MQIRKLIIKLSSIITASMEPFINSISPVRLLLKRDGDLRLIMIVLVHALGLKEYRKDFELLASRIHALKKASGTKHTVSYLKECCHALACHAAGCPFTFNKVGINLGRNGKLPLLIPGALRRVILSIWEGKTTSANILVFRGVLSLLQVWRVMRVRGAAPNWETVTGPFTGSRQHLSIPAWISHHLKPLIRENTGTSWFISESVGPNLPMATWGLLADSFALVHHPKLVKSLIAYGLCNRMWAWLASFTVSYLTATSLTKVLLLLSPDVKDIVESWSIGRLATFHEGGGKVRIVGVVDGWTSLLLRPLHDTLYRVLGRIEQDGTFNQSRPITNLIRDYVVPCGLTTFSFDLTAATDRLPVQFQTDVLLSLGIKYAYEWESILVERDWDSRLGKIRYTVGQPMGAYSSWASLAITHHVIVQIAASRAGWTCWFPYYGLLGDDIVIANKAVADHYLSVMRELGVEINLTKSLVSQRGVVEFAKKLIHPHLGELSPVGARVLLGTVRSVLLWPTLVMELVDKTFPLYPSSIHNLLGAIREMRRSKRFDRHFYNRLLFAVLAPGKFYSKCRMSPNWVQHWSASVGLSPESLGMAILAIGPFWQKEFEKVMRDKAEALDVFSRNYWRYTIIPSLGWYSYLFQVLVIIHPGFWLYRASLRRGVSQYSGFVRLDGLFGFNYDSLGAIELGSLTDYRDYYDFSYNRRGIPVKHTLALHRLYGNIVEFKRSNDSFVPVVYKAPETRIIPYVCATCPSYMDGASETGNGGC